MKIKLDVNTSENQEVDEKERQQIKDNKWSDWSDCQAKETALVEKPRINQRLSDISDNDLC